MCLFSVINSTWKNDIYAIRVQKGYFIGVYSLLSDQYWQTNLVDSFNFSFDKDPLDLKLYVQLLIDTRTTLCSCLLRYTQSDQSSVP